jgi:lysyl-tRNA synthetase class 2
LFFLLLSFLLTFVAVRTYTRLARVRAWGSASPRGVHLHHVVPGIVASLAAGTAIIAFRPGSDSLVLLSGLFGVGAALTLDEFALILHLDDVYWAEEGRKSIEATLMGFTFASLCLLTTAPLEADPSRDVPHWVLGGVIVANMSSALVTFLKGKLKLGVFGLVVPGVGVVGAARLAKPHSLWSRRFYAEEKLVRSRSRARFRHERYGCFKHHVYDVIGGAPSANTGGGGRAGAASGPPSALAEVRRLRPDVEGVNLRTFLQFDPQRGISGRHRGDRRDWIDL